MSSQGNSNSQSNGSTVTQGSPQATGGEGGDASTGNTQEGNGNAFAESLTGSSGQGQDWYSCCTPESSQTAGSGGAIAGSGGNAGATGGDAGAVTIQSSMSLLVGLVS